MERRREGGKVGRHEEKEGNCNVGLRVCKQKGAQQATANGIF